MQLIAEWLEKLGMSKYAECFAENDIDTTVLRHLTDQDLKELGVSLGHRRKMLAAIAEVTGEQTSLQIELGRALFATQGYAAPESGEPFARARQLCELLTI